MTDKWEVKYVRKICLGIGIPVNTNSHRMICNTIFHSQSSDKDLKQNEKWMKQIVHEHNTYGLLVEALELLLSADPDMPTYESDYEYAEKILEQAKQQ